MAPADQAGIDDSQLAGRPLTQAVLTRIIGKKNYGRRKIAGARKNKIEPADPNTPENEATHNSVSQRSYTQVAEHFDAMIEMCQNEPLYTRTKPISRSPYKARSCPSSFSFFKFN